jgi:CTP synthase
MRFTYARERKVPFFGICLGMQCATIEYARNVAGLEHADSTEFDASAPKPGDLQTARACWAWTKWAGPCGWARGLARLVPGSLARGFTAQPRFGAAPASLRIQSRVRTAILIKAGLRLQAATPDGVYAEIVEVPGHPWFLGCQFHPEFKSKPLSAASAVCFVYCG